MTTKTKSFSLIAYGLPGLPLAVLGLPLVVYLPPLYAGLPGLSAASVGLVLFLSRLFDVFTDPAIGWASDRWQSRWGRRIPWMVAGAPLLILAAWFLFVPVDNAGSAYLLLWSSIAYLGWTLVYLPYTTLGAELSVDYDERSRITAFREGFFVLGTVVAIVLPPLMSQLDDTTQQPASDSMLSLAVFLTITLPLALGYFLWRIREPARPATVATTGMNWRAGWRLLVNNAPFRRLLIAYLLNGMANGFPAALFLFFVIHVLGGTQAIAGGFLLLYFVCAVAGLPLWYKLAKINDWSKHRLWCMAMLWAALVFIFSPLLGEGDYIAYGVICILAGICLGIDQAIPASMQADVVDEDTAAGGDGRAGLYFGLWGMATKMAFALAIGIAYPLLSLAGFDANTQNSAFSLTVLAWLYAGVPVVVKLGVVGMMWRFPLDRERHAELRAQISQQ